MYASQEVELIMVFIKSGVLVKGQVELIMVLSKLVCRSKVMINKFYEDPTRRLRELCKTILVPPTGHTDRHTHNIIYRTFGEIHTHYKHNLGVNI